MKKEKLQGLSKTLIRSEMQTVEGFLMPLYPSTEDKHTKNRSLSDKNFYPDLGKKRCFFTTNSKIHNPNTKANTQDEK